MADIRSTQYTTALFVLEIEGSPVGVLHSCDGGEPYGVVAVERAAAGAAPGKHIAGCEFAPLEMSFGVGMDAALYSWLASWLEGKSDSKSGSVIFVDYNFREQGRLDFQNAQITKVAFSTFDASSRDPMLISVTLQPDRTTRRTTSGGTTSKLIGRQKRAMSSNFQLTLTNLPTTHVHAVQLPTTAAVPSADAVGVLRLPAAGMEYSVTNLECAVSAQDAQAYRDYLQDFVVNGNNQQAMERTGTLEVLAPDFKEVLFTIGLENLGIVRVTDDRQERGAQAVTRVAVEFYCERMTFNAGKGATGEPATTSTGTPGTSAATTVAATMEISRLVANAVDLLATTRLQVPTAAGSFVEDVLAGATIPATSELVARRLLSTTTQDADVSVAPARYAQGVDLGRAWAQEQATLPELTDVAALESSDWTALALGSSHTLLAALKDDGALPQNIDAAVDLERDPYVDGIVAGAAEVLSNARPHLGG